MQLRADFISTKLNNFGSRKDSSRMPLRSVIRVFLMAFMPSKPVPPMILLNLRKRKKIKLSNIRWIERLFLFDDVLLSQELPDAKGIVSKCIVIVKQPQFVLSSPLTHWVKHILPEHLEDLLMDHVALLRELKFDNAPSHHRMWSTWHFCFL